MRRAADLLPYGCGPQPPPPAPSPAPPPPPPVTCSGATHAFDDAPGTNVVGYTALPSDYGGGALNWTNWNAINGTLWGSVRTWLKLGDSCALEHHHEDCFTICCMQTCHLNIMMTTGSR